MFLDTVLNKSPDFHFRSSNSDTDPAPNGHQDLQIFGK